MNMQSRAAASCVPCQAVKTWKDQQKSGFLSSSSSHSVWGLVDRLRSGTPVTFPEVQQAITESFDYTPKPFNNGGVSNGAGTNEGSCKLLSMGILVGLTAQEALTCYGTVTSPNDIILQESSLAL